jgi:hypothetical protein
MAYITDAAREYAKKHIAKDANIPEFPIDFDEDKEIGPGAKIIQIYKKDVDAAIELLNDVVKKYGFPNNEIDLHHIADEYYLLRNDFEIEGDELLDKSGLIHIITDHLDDIAIMIKKLRKQAPYNEELRRIMRSLYKDKYDALDKIDAILDKFHEKWNDETGSAILKKYHLGGPGSLDEFSPSLFDEYEYYSERPSDAEIEEYIDNYISNFAK